MVSKIISGGQTGVDRAALDAAIELDIPHGGWVPKGRIAEDGILPEKYHVREMATDSYDARTKKNILFSDGTLLLSRNDLTGGSRLTQTLALQHNRSLLYVDLRKTNAFKAAQLIGTWIAEQGIRVLNVAGPRASQDPEIYRITRDLLKTIFYLNLTEASMPLHDLQASFFPKTVQEAVEHLMTRLSLKDKSTIARMAEEELSFLYSTLGEYIEERFGLRRDDPDGISPFGASDKNDGIPPDEETRVIIRALWTQLKKTHAMRLV